MNAITAINKIISDIAKRMNARKEQEQKNEVKPAGVDTPYDQINSFIYNQGVNNASKIMENASAKPDAYISDVASLPVNKPTSAPLPRPGILPIVKTTEVKPATLSMPEENDVVPFLNPLFSSQFSDLIKRSEQRSRQLAIGTPLSKSQREEESNDVMQMVGVVEATGGINSLKKLVSNIKPGRVKEFLSSIWEAKPIKGVRDKAGKAKDKVVQWAEKMRTSKSVEPIKETVSSIKTFIGDAVGKQQKQQFVIKKPWEFIGDKAEKRGLLNEDDAVALANFYDNPKKYPLAPELRAKAGDDLLEEISALKKVMTESQVDRGLLTSTLDDDSYLRTFLVQADGSVPTATQLNAMMKKSPSSLTERLMGIKKGEGVSGMSLKNRYNTARKFENADVRDAWLEQFGLKTNRNFFEVMNKTVKQVSNQTSHYDLVASIRASAKKETPGVKEIYDPVELKAFREETFSEYKKVREDVLEWAKNKKLILADEYKALKGNTDTVIDDLKYEVKSDFDLPSDIKKAQMEQLAIDKSMAKKHLFYDLKLDKKGIDKKVNSFIEDIYESRTKKLQKKIDDIGDKFSIAKDTGYRPTKDVKIAQQLTGLVFDETSAKALEKIFAETKPSSLEDFIRGIKLFQATFDLFMVPEVARQRFSTQGASGIVNSTWKMGEKEIMKTAPDAVEHGLMLGRPSDVDIDFFKNTSNAVDEIDKSWLAKKAGKVSDFLDEVPGVGAVKKKIGKGVQALEDVQYKSLLPSAKLNTYNELWPQFQKKFPNKSVAEVKTMAAEFINDSFQGLNWERMMAKDTAVGRFMSKDIQRRLRYLFFGPDRLAAVASRYGKAFTKEGGAYRKAILRQMVAGATVLETLNYAFNGHSTLENERGNEFELQIPQMTDDKGNPVSLNILGTWIEPLKAANKPKSFIFNKAGILPNIYESWIGEYAPDTIMGKMWETAPLPFTLQNLSDYARQDDKLRTGDASLGVKATQSASEFLGVPAIFRSGESKETSFLDVINGRAGIEEWAVGSDIKSPYTRLREELDVAIKAKDSEALKEIVSRAPDKETADRLIKYSMNLLPVPPEQRKLYNLTGKDVVELYKIDIKSAIKDKDKQRLLDMVNTLPKESQKKSLIEYITTQIK